VTSAVVGGQSLPVPKANPTKIVVIGDTGCRLQNGNGTQSCNDPNPNGTDTPYPFAAVASLAAAQNPDLVLHVGDYAYRDNACPAGQGFNCGGSPWGFGWDTWQADLFSPGAALLAAAPWIMTRGNHEQCNRAGQGWYHPIFGYATGTSPTNPIPAFVPVMRSVNPGTYFPPPINLALHGHTHNFQAISFQTGTMPDGGTLPDGGTTFQPAGTLVSGNAGDILDTAMPYPLTGSSVSAVNDPSSVQVATISGVQQFATSDNGTPFQNPNSMTDNDYGYMVLQFNAGTTPTWTATEYRTDNTVRDVCTVQQSGQINCQSWGIILPNDAGVY
jgi:hypothetical protein